MATMAEPQCLSDALVAFALDGRFPDDISELPPVSETQLAPAIEALGAAKEELEADIHTINEETKGDVSSWIKNAKELQEDIVRSKTIANSIVLQSEAPDVSGEAVQEAEDKVEFLNREVQYSQRLYEVLKGIQHVNELLSKVEQAIRERRILDSLHLLEESWAALDHVDVSKSCRVMKMLNLRTFELKSDVHEVFDQVWKKLVQVDIDAGTVAIRDVVDDGQMLLSDAVIGLKAYKETDERMEQLWRNLDAAIVSPRMDRQRASLPGIRAVDGVLELHGNSPASVEALFSDLEAIFGLVAQKLPSGLLPSLCRFMMADVVPKLIRDWLTPLVPTSLKDMDQFQEMIGQAEEFCTTLGQLGYGGFEELSDWVGNAPSIWLGKCRQTALDTVRSRLAGGIGESRQVEKIEKHMVSLSEGKELATTGAGATADTKDWGDAWGEDWDDDDENHKTDEPRPDTGNENSAADDEDDGTGAWGWDEGEAERDIDQPAEVAKQSGEGDEEDNTAAAWGWDDDDTTKEPEGKPPSRGKAASGTEQTRELVLKETYNISSMPDPVLELIFAILEDGAELTKEDTAHGHIAATAPGLFTLPTFALALFRAISPYYYSLDVGGNMFLYNDAMYLSERLSDFSSDWKQRDDLTARAKTMLRLDNDIKSLQSFANRSYAAEMNIQKTVLRDLLGNSQSLMQQDDSEASVESGMARIRTVAATWEPILARSVWSQAIGSLAETLATKLITDVLEMSSIGQDEAYGIASLIAAATQLDDLFLPSKLAGAEAAGEEGGEVPATAQYAPSWLRLKFLSEVLQSNLNEVRYLWGESELSLYFTVAEVVDLIEASFEGNSRTREAIREIQAKPHPLAA